MNNVNFYKFSFTDYVQPLAACVFTWLASFLFFKKQIEPMDCIVVCTTLLSYNFLTLNKHIIHTGSHFGFILKMAVFLISQAVIAHVLAENSIERIFRHWHF